MHALTLWELYIELCEAIYIALWEVLRLYLDLSQQPDTCTSSLRYGKSKKSFQTFSSCQFWQSSMVSISNNKVHCSELFYSGTKNLSKCLQKVTQGRVRDKGLTWFPELVDKRTFPILMCNGVFSVFFRKEYKGASILGYEWWWPEAS